MSLKKLLKDFKEANKPKLRDMKGNLLENKGWYLDYSDLTKPKIGIPCYFTGKLNKYQGTGYAVLETIDKYREGAFETNYPNGCTINLVQIENPKEYLTLLKKEINEKSKFPVEQLKKLNLQLLKKSAEFIESKLKQLAA